MKAKRGIFIAALAAVLIAGAFASKTLLAQKEPETVVESQQETMQEPETSPEATKALEYVTDENWDAMVRVYRIIADNYDTAKDLVASGQEDPSGTVKKAAELIEYGKECGRDNLLNQEAEEVLRDMVDTADSLLALIEAGGGEVAVESGTDETENAEITENQEENTEIQEDVVTE